MSGDSKAGANFNQPSPQTVTKGELDALVAARPKPVVERHLTPGGELETSVRQAYNLKNEARISQIRDRLNNANERLNRDHGKAMVRGTAKSNFDRSR